MSDAPAPTAAGPASLGVCPTHGAPAVCTCARCGVFCCADDSRLVAGKRHCLACAERPELSWLSNLRAEWTGQRDAWGWGLPVLGLLELGGVVLAAGEWQELSPVGRVSVGLLVLQAGVHLWCFTGHPWARRLLFAPAGLGVAAGVLTQSPWAGLGWGVGALLSVAVFSDVRSRLFFGAPVTDAALRKYHGQYHDNPPALWASRLAAVGLLVPFLGPLAVVLALVGLARVDKKATPPVGNAGTAALALVGGVLETALVAAMLFFAR